MIRAILAAAMGVGLLAACSALPPSPLTRSDSESGLFGPVSMKLDSFSKIKNWNGGPSPDGIEAHLEFDDQFGDRTKAAGSVYFELYQYRPDWPDPRGPRLAEPWTRSLTGVDQQKMYWESASGTYTFKLDYPEARLDRSYVLAATYQSTMGQRLFTRLIIPNQIPEKGRKPGASPLAPKP